MESNPRPALLVTFRPEPGIDGARALRGLLKVALRRFGLRAVGIAEPAEVEPAGEEERA